MLPPLVLLGIGMAAILGGIIVFRVNAFLALIGAAVLVSLLAPGDPATKIARVADGFGRTAGSVGIVIALAAIIGNAMTESGGADRIVRFFLELLGEQHAAVALGATAFIVSLPVFFDTVFFLLAPLARSMYARTDKNYLKYLLAMSASGVATHTLVPPHPGPLAVADALGIDLGVMILVGVVIALPSAVVGFQFARMMDRRMPVPMRPRPGVESEAPPLTTQPPLGWALLPVLMPLVLISMATIVDALRTSDTGNAALWNALRPVTSVIGNPNMALLLATLAAIWLFAHQRKPSRTEMAAMVESSLMGAGVVILIVAAGGALGATLQAAQLGPAIQSMFVTTDRTSGVTLLLVAFAVTVVFKIAQGSSTVAMITTAGMVAAMIKGMSLPFHGVYLAAAISSGALVGSWMNDAGFWVFSKIGGVSEVETLRSWTPLLAIVGTTAMCVTVALSLLFPFKP